jgi:AraC-like DNA-binding protein
MDVLQQLFSTFKVSANIIHNGQYCGNWAIDTSGSQYISFHIVSFGRCFMSIDGKAAQVILEPGDMLIFPKDISHCVSNDKQFTQEINSKKSLDYSQGQTTDGTGLVCGYFAHNHPLVTSITDHLPDYIVLKRSQLGKQELAVAYLLDALLEESLDPDSGSELILAKISEAILAIIFRQHLPSETGVLAAAIHPKLANAIKHIHQHSERKWTVEQLAELCFMSRAAFSDLFKSVLGQSPIEYLTQWRFSIAYRMLADDNATTLSAALSCGYDNESSFSKAFKRVMGVSPGAVRAQLRGVQ